MCVWALAWWAWSAASAAWQVAYLGSLHFHNKQICCKRNVHFLARTEEGARAEEEAEEEGAEDVE